MKYLRAVSTDEYAIVVGIPSAIWGLTFKPKIIDFSQKKPPKSGKFVV